MAVSDLAAAKPSQEAASTVSAFSFYYQHPPSPNTPTNPHPLLSEGEKSTTSLLYRRPAPVRYGRSLDRYWTPPPSARSPRPLTVVIE